MQVEWIQTTDGFANLADAWDELLADSDADRPFLSWTWMYQWWRHYGQQRRLWLLTVRDAGRLVGVAPLQTEAEPDRWGARALRFLGVGHVCTEYLGFILRRGCQIEATRAIVDCLCHDLAGRWDLLDLNDLPDTGATLDSLREVLTLGGRTYCRWPGWSYHLVDLAPTWDEFLATSGTKRRQRNRKILRDIEKRGARYREITEPDELPDAWDHLRRLHQMRWTARGEAGCFASKRFEQFHAAVMSAFLQSGELCLSFLDIEQEPVAASYCVRRNGHVYSYQAGLDPAWLKHRAGQALHLYELQAAIARGDRCYDMLGGDAEAKSRRSTRTVPTSRLLIAAPRATGRAHFARRVAGYHLKQHAKRLAPEWLLNVVRRLPQSASA